MNLKDYISEAVSHGGNAKYSNEPEYGDSTDDIINWLKSYGIKGYQWKDRDSFRYMEGNPPVKYGELIWYAGPCNKSIDTHWVCLMNNSDRGNPKPEATQEICIYTKNKNRMNFIRNLLSGEEYQLKFSEAIILMKRMIDRPSAWIENF